MIHRMVEWLIHDDIENQINIWIDRITMVVAWISAMAIVVMFIYQIMVAM